MVTKFSTYRTAAVTRLVYSPSSNTTRELVKKATEYNKLPSRVATGGTDSRTESDLPRRFAV